MVALYGPRRSLEGPSRKHWFRRMGGGCRSAFQQIASPLFLLLFLLPGEDTTSITTSKRKVEENSHVALFKSIVKNDLIWARRGLGFSI